MAQPDTKHMNGFAHAEPDAANSNPAARPSPDEGLKIVIVGAGIGGFTAAIALRQQGHEVTLLEQSKTSNETGAALHLAPNANGLLRRLGLNPEDIGAVPLLGHAEYAASGELNFFRDMSGTLSIWQHQWLLAHRVELHRALREMAMSQEGKGKAATLRLASRVASVDTQNATVTLESGEKISGDLVIGADGVRSVTRKMVPGGDVKPFDSGKSAFRFLIKRDVVLNDPVTREFAERYGCFTMWVGDDRRIVMYPCSYNTLLNFVCIHPSELTHASGDTYNEGGYKSKLLDVYKGFGPRVEALLSKADVASLKVWNLLDMAVIPSWTQDRLVLLGDAAHPFLPHQGQGGAVAIEDAVSLAVMLPKDTPREEITDRMKLYEKCRYERANMIQEFTRIAGLDPGQRKEGRLNMMQFVTYNFGHDEYDHSTQALRKWEWSQRPELVWQMPVSFGPPPRQWGTSAPESSAGAALKFVKASVKFKTSRTVLQILLPSPSFSFKSPGTVAYASYIVTSTDENSRTNSRTRVSLGLYLHGVQYTKKDGSTLSGRFLVVVFQDDPDMVVKSMEVLGIPSVHCSLQSRSAKQQRYASVFARSYLDIPFMNIQWDKLQETQPMSENNGEAAAQDASTEGSATAAQPHSDTESEEQGTLTYRYIPAVGQPGKADVEYAVWIPDASAEDGSGVNAKNTTSYTRKAKITFDNVDPKKLPTLYDMISRLAEIPVREIVEASVVEAEGSREHFGRAVRVE